MMIDERASMAPPHPERCDHLIADSVNLLGRCTTEDHPQPFLEDNVNFILYALRWLTDTLPIDQQTTTYRQRKIEMARTLDNYLNRGTRSSSTN
jgi:hypothetical protein